MSFRAESATAPNRSVFHSGMQYPTHHNASQKGVFDIFLRILKPTPSLCRAVGSVRAETPEHRRRRSFPRRLSSRKNPLKLTELPTGEET